MNREVICFDAVAPARERGLKYNKFRTELFSQTVAPARERGLKFHKQKTSLLKVQGRSREGAWIEIKGCVGGAPKTIVAPARERGLK